MGKATRGMWGSFGLALALATGACSSTGEVAAEADAPSEPAASNAPASPPAPPAQPTGTGTYESNVADYAIGVRDVMARYEPPAAVGSEFASTLTLELVEFGGRCGELGAGVSHRSAKTIALRIQRVGATAADAALKTGTYTIGSSAHGEVAFERQVLSASCAPDSVPTPFDAACMNAIEVKSFFGTHVAGTYALLAIDGRYVRGTFDAELCAAKAPSTPIVCE